MRTLYHLNEHKSKSDLISAVEGIPLESSGARLGNALSYVFTENFKLRNGHRPGVPVAVLAIADGASRDPVTKYAKQLQGYANIVAVGIKRATENVLQEIATPSKIRPNYFYDRQVEGLDSFINDVATLLCNSSAESGKCDGNECGCNLSSNTTVVQGISL